MMLYLFIVKVKPVQMIQVQSAKEKNKTSSAKEMSDNIQSASKLESARELVGC